ncbi:hypothetical protein ACFQZI_00305 [Mucilaginibacter lutimaris]|uniref:Uncharacterized protein n=1 Tax=Mucilaginibacter lutimaris TaxID=931629 RepID=A0ABW2ZBN3_9SPHI
MFYFLAPDQTFNMFPIHFIDYEMIGLGTIGSFANLCTSMLANPNFQPPYSVSDSSLPRERINGHVIQKMHRIKRISLHIQEIAEPHPLVIFSMERLLTDVLTNHSHHLPDMIDQVVRPYFKEVSHLKQFKHRHT